VQIYRNDDRIEVRSAGMSAKSKHPLFTSDVSWADLILVMESRYKSRIIDQFRDLPLPRIENLDIPDEYQFMDSDLVDTIQKGVESHNRKFELNKR
jgi:protein-tyrosine phosphatase